MNSRAPFLRDSTGFHTSQQNSRVPFSLDSDSFHTNLNRIHNVFHFHVVHVVFTQISIEFTYPVKADSRVEEVVFAVALVDVQRLVLWMAVGLKVGLEVDLLAWRMAILVVEFQELFKEGGNQISLR